MYILFIKFGQHIPGIVDPLAIVASETCPGGYEEYSQRTEKAMPGIIMLYLELRCGLNSIRSYRIARECSSTPLNRVTTESHYRSEHIK